MFQSHLSTGRISENGSYFIRSQSHLSTGRISDNGSYFIRCLSFTWAQTGYQTTEVISYDVSVSPKYRQDIRKRKLFHTMSQSHLSTGRISDNEVISHDASVWSKYRQDIRQRKLSHTMFQSHLSTDRISENGSYFIRCLSLTWVHTGNGRTKVISCDVSVSPEYRQDIRQQKLSNTMFQSHLSTDRISENGSYFIWCLSASWLQAGCQTTEVISYDVSVSPEYRQDVRQRKLFHMMSQSHLSTGRMSDNGSYFIRCLSLT